MMLIILSGSINGYAYASHLPYRNDIDNAQRDSHALVYKVLPKNFHDTDGDGDVDLWGKKINFIKYFFKLNFFVFLIDKKFF